MFSWYIEDTAPCIYAKTSIDMWLNIAREYKPNVQPYWSALAENIHVRPAKIQISLRMRAVWAESSLHAFWIIKYATFLHADNEDSDKTARMRMLICVFARGTGRMVHFLAFTCKCRLLINFISQKNTFNIQLRVKQMRLGNTLSLKALITTSADEIL